MSQALLARAEALRERHRLYETVPGSGYHDNDRSPVNGAPVAPQKTPDPYRPGKTLPRASEHLVPFYDHDDGEQVHFVGPDAEKALAALQAWLARNARRDVASMPGTDRKLVLKIIPRLALQTVDGLPRLVVKLSVWNDVLHALLSEGVGLSGLPLVPEEG